MLNNIRKKISNNYLAIAGIILGISLLYLIFLAPTLREVVPFRLNSIVYYLCMLFIVLKFTDIYHFNLSYLKEKKVENKTKFLINKTIVIFIFTIIIVGKTFLMVMIRKNIDSPFPLHEIIGTAILYIFSGFAEEYLFSGLLFEGFKKKGMPYFLNVLIVCTLFAFYHRDFSFYFFIPFGIRFVILLGYRFYPSLIFFSIFHCLWNEASNLCLFWYTLRRRLKIVIIKDNKTYIWW